MSHHGVSYDPLAIEYVNVMVGDWKWPGGALVALAIKAQGAAYGFFLQLIRIGKISSNSKSN